MDDYDKAAQLRKRYNKEKNICDPKEDKAKDVKLKDRISIDAQCTSGVSVSIFDPCVMNS